MTTTTFDLDTPDGGTVSVALRALTRVEWSEIVAQHGPRPSSGDRLWNEATFPPALIAASTGLKAADARQWWEEAAQETADALYEACLRLSSPGSAEWAVRRMKNDPRLLAEVQAAMRAGLSHAEFLTWPADSQDLAIGLALVEGDRCPGGCGSTRAGMTDPTAYRAVVSGCLWCQQLDIKRQEIQAEDRGHRHVTLIARTE